MAALFFNFFFFFLGVFGRVDFREDGKKGEKWEDKIFRECLAGRGGEREREENMVGFICFLSGPIKKFSLQNEEKTEWGEFDRYMTKMLIYICT